MVLTLRGALERVTGRHVFRGNTAIVRARLSGRSVTIAIKLRILTLALEVQMHPSNHQNKREIDIHFLLYRLAIDAYLYLLILAHFISFFQPMTTPDPCRLWPALALQINSSSISNWTDGRYFLQADKQLSSSWILMCAGNHGVPSTREWLNDVLAPGGRVGIDPVSNLSAS
ncbi:putative Xaa-Pro aminopeptidase P-like protein [Corchorus capsularis]|uniref:Putative Xaa-Pro aminopeptidase P-like protein n=1 Tax=Corchorus capsularis TaxID=210143 RepID=A0A1R3ILA0_COCAP|nr:putative Xaa-Pro aminopeptidase P-like protein [Corchorus capsularis]